MVFSTYKDLSLRLQTTESGEERVEEEEIVGLGEGDDGGGANMNTGSEEEEEEEEEGEEGDAAAHSRLLSAITHMGHQKRRGQRSEATPNVSEYHLSSQREGE